MANLTTAQGKMVFLGDWSFIQKSLFWEVFQNRLSSEKIDYYTDLDELSVDDESINFTGIGRSSYENNLSYIQGWLHGEGADVPKDNRKLDSKVCELAETMNGNNLSILITYHDYDDAVEMFYKETGFLIPLIVDDRAVSLTYFADETTSIAPYTRETFKLENIDRYYETELCDVLEECLERGITLDQKLIDKLEIFLESDFYSEPVDVLRTFDII